MVYVAVFATCVLSGNSWSALEHQSGAEDEQNLATFDVAKMSREQMSNVLSYVNDHFPETFRAVRCVSENKMGNQCRLQDVTTPWFPQQRMAKTHLLLRYLRNTQGEHTMESALRYRPTQPARIEHNHPASTLNRICHQMGWRYLVKQNKNNLDLWVFEEHDLKKIIPRQTKRIGESVSATRYALIVQSLQRIVATHPALQGVILPAILEETSYQSGEQLQPESDACEYKSSIKDDPTYALSACINVDYSATQIVFETTEH